MRPGRIVAGVAAALLLWSCASSGGTSVEMDEYSVRAPDEIPSGEVRFEVHNLGAIEHELEVLRTGLDPDDLPVKDAEVRVGAKGLETVGKTGRMRSGAAAELAVRLRRGDYVLICNVPGHYQSGMRTGLRAL
jgi:uncharacterized cupredoxin-like copper-binding protein